LVRGHHFFILAKEREYLSASPCELVVQGSQSSHATVKYMHIMILYLRGPFVVSNIL
jgi:hypothetical protein